jgi:hypothetical protein
MKELRCYEATSRTKERIMPPAHQARRRRAEYYIGLNSPRGLRQQTLARVSKVRAGDRICGASASRCMAAS